MQESWLIKLLPEIYINYLGGLFSQNTECIIWLFVLNCSQEFPGGPVVKNPPASAGDSRDPGLIPGFGRSSGEGNDNPLQYSCLGNPKNRVSWWATVMGSHRVIHNWATKHTSSHLSGCTVGQQLQWLMTWFLYNWMVSNTFCFANLLTLF